MRKLVLTCLASGMFIASGLAQTLFTYGDHPVSKEQFVKVYDKNSINKKPDYSEAALRDYLDLYALFRMKVNEADLMHLDTTQSIQKELDTYRRQLAKNYLTDDQVTKRLIHEAYDRMKEDVHVEHILIACPPGADTVAAYNKIDSIYHLVTSKKATFENMAKQYSEDRGSKDNGGDIGYITALETVYPFENAIYTTPVGTISAPFRTQFGYHIVKVIDKRPARGEIKVAQIMVQVQKSKGEAGLEAAHKRIDSVDAMLKHGVPFSELVKKYSDDKFSVKDNGELPPFGVGRMVPQFENAAFSLKKPGDISKPIQTDYGFHIIKLIAKYPIKPYDSLEAQIKHKVENDSRAEVAKQIFFDKIKAKNGFKEYPANLDAIVTKVENNRDTAGKPSNTFRAGDYRNMGKPLFTLGGKDYLQSDFASYMQSVSRGRILGPKSGVVHDIYKMYVNATVNDFEEHKLVEENPEFNSLMEEYRDGIMLFELMDRNVWSKASKDTVGLKAFYEAHKDKYMWEPGFDGVVYKFKNEAAMKEGEKALSTSITDEDLMKQLNTNTTPDAVAIQRGRYEFSRFKDAPRSELIQGKVTTAVKNGDGTYTAVKVEEIYNTPSQKSLDDARGYVVAEYQDYLEKEWNDQLRKKYPVKVNQQVFQSMVKK